MTDGSEELRRAVEEARSQATAREAAQRAEVDRRARQRIEEERAVSDAQHAIAPVIAAFIETMRAGGNPGMRPCTAVVPPVGGWVKRRFGPRRQEVGAGWILRPSTSSDPTYGKSGQTQSFPGIALLTDGRVVEHWSEDGADPIVLHTQDESTGELKLVDPRAFGVGDLAAILHRYRRSLEDHTGSSATS
jgi:hypothetical protein